MFSISRSLMCVFAVALTAVSLTACGDGDETSASLSKTEFIREADAICRDARETQLKEFRAYQADTSTPKKGVAAGETLGRTVALPPLEDAMEELQELSLPAQDAEGAEEFLKGMEEAVENGRQEPITLIQPAGQNAFSDVQPVAASYGFKDCAQG